MEEDREKKGRRRRRRRKLLHMMSLQTKRLFQLSMFLGSEIIHLSLSEPPLSETTAHLIDHKKRIIIDYQLTKIHIMNSNLETNLRLNLLPSYSHQFESKNF